MGSEAILEGDGNGGVLEGLKEFFYRVDDSAIYYFRVLPFSDSSLSLSINLSVLLPC